jgi:predicted component of type VI protein secretion system
MLAELVDAARQYASDEGFATVGEISVAIVSDSEVKAGRFEVRAEIKTTAANGAPGAGLSEAPPAAGVPNVTVPPVVSAPVTPPTVATPSIPPVPAPAAAPPAREKKAVLVLGDGTNVAVKPGVLSIGRSAESSVPLNDTNVSRRHAEIRSRGEGARIDWYLSDVGSTNGTMLNGVKISGEQKLKNGDALMFGSTAARFEVS